MSQTELLIKVAEDIGSIKSTLEAHHQTLDKQHETLVEHVKRTNLLENEIKDHAVRLVSLEKEEERERGTRAWIRENWLKLIFVVAALASGAGAHKLLQLFSGLG
jgi:hypothetical protein